MVRCARGVGGNVNAKPGERIALVGRRERAERIGRILENAGYEVEYRHDGAPRSDDIDIVLSANDRHEKPLVDTRSGQEERMESIARLAGGLAHDFNNILSVISICADDAMERALATDPTRECLMDIREAVDRGTAITRDLLSFSGRGIQATNVVDFDTIVSEAKRIVGPLLGDAIVFRMSLAANTAPVRLDPEQWNAVFAHLASNARKAMPKGGSFTIRTREVSIEPNHEPRAKTRGRYVELTVTDSGCGISETARARIFDPFFSTESFGKSRGLGLSVVHGVVEQSGGWIDVTSRVDEGTKFRIVLPVACDAPASSTTTISSSARTKAEVRLLLVEDEDAVRRIAFRALVRAGYDVFHARTAEDALAMLPTLPALDLLVTDVVLPGMDGRTLASTIVEGAPDVTVLYTSGYTDDEVLRCGVLEAEMFFLQKPYTTSVLVQRVEQVLAKAKRLHF